MVLDVEYCSKYHYIIYQFINNIFFKCILKIEIGYL